MLHTKFHGNRSNSSGEEDFEGFLNQRTNGPVNAHLISWPSKTQNIKNQENIWSKKI